MAYNMLQKNKPKTEKIESQLWGGPPGPKNLNIDSKQTDAVGAIACQILFRQLLDDLKIMMFFLIILRSQTSGPSCALVPKWQQG